jgi:hypothetical protein
MVCMSAATPTIEAAVVLLLVLLRRPARAVARLQHSCRVTRQQHGWCFWVSSTAGLDSLVRFVGQGRFPQAHAGQ